MSLITDLRDDLYLQIAAKKAALEYSINTFTLEKTWIPYEELPDLTRDHPDGKVYLIGGNPIGYGISSRTNLVLGEYSVMIGYQRIPTAQFSDSGFTAEIDSYTDFMEELEETCRLDVTPSRYVFTRLEYLRDPDGLPLSYIMLRDTATFEAFFTVVYKRVRAGF